MVYIVLLGDIVTQKGEKVKLLTVAEMDDFQREFCLLRIFAGKKIAKRAINLKGQVEEIEIYLKPIPKMYLEEPFNTLIHELAIYFNNDGYNMVLNHYRDEFHSLHDKCEVCHETSKGVLSVECTDCFRLHHVHCIDSADWRCNSCKRFYKREI